MDTHTHTAFPTSPLPFVRTSGKTCHGHPIQAPLALGTASRKEAGGLQFTSDGPRLLPAEARLWRWHHWWKGSLMSPVFQVHSTLKGKGHRKAHKYKLHISVPPYASNDFLQTFPPASQPLIPGKYSLPIRTHMLMTSCCQILCSQRWELNRRLTLSHIWESKVMEGKQDL